jgi:hypothetical protein
MKKRVNYIFFVLFLCGFGCKNPYKLKQFAYYDLNYGKVGLMISQSGWINKSKEDSFKNSFIYQQINKSQIDTIFEENILNALNGKIKYDFLGYFSDSLHLVIDTLVKQNNYRYYLIYEPQVDFYSSNDSIVKKFNDESNLKIFTSKGYLLASLRNNSSFKNYSDSSLRIESQNNTSLLLERLRSNPFPIEKSAAKPWNWQGARIVYEKDFENDEKQYEVIIYRDDDRFYGIANDISFLNNNTTWVSMKPNSYIRFFTSDNKLKIFIAFDEGSYNLKENRVNFFECKYPTDPRNIFIDLDFVIESLPSGYKQAKQDTIVY